jgi:hypothetical protein
MCFLFELLMLRKLWLFFVWLTFEAATLSLFVILCRAGCVGREEAGFELPLACCRLLMRLRRKCL